MHADAASARAAVFATFEQVHRERMADLPLLNPALRVEAVGFEAWEGGWLGVLVTPWSMNLLLLAGPEGPAVERAPGTKRSLEFPSGDYEFVAATDPTLGAYESCSLLSPVLELADQAAARATAEAALRLLLEPALRTVDPAARDDDPRPLTRRQLLFRGRRESSR